MNLVQRIALAAKLGNYLLENNDEWMEAKQLAYRENPWFVPEFIDAAALNIARLFLDQSYLQNWATGYHLPAINPNPKAVGIVMAGNIPLVGFHDFLCAFIQGHHQRIKLSSKDRILLTHLVGKLTEWDTSVSEIVEFAEQLKGCDAYIATGSNNSSRYFESYFGKFPNIIRRNRTSVAVLDGTETQEELTGLGQDLMLYFGLGCRNVTKIYAPVGYDFVPLIDSLKHYDYYLDFHKYNHNFDYQLAILLLNHQFYMNSGSLLFSENEALFSPISLVNYSFYKDGNLLASQLRKHEDIQCIIGHDYVPFGKGQEPTLVDYADNVDTMAFLNKL